MKEVIRYNLPKYITISLAFKYDGITIYLTQLLKNAAIEIHDFITAIVI